MWKHVRNTLLILLTGTVIGVLAGELGVRTPSAGRSIPAGNAGTASGTRTEVSGSSLAAGGTTGYCEPVAIEREESGAGPANVGDLREERDAVGITDAVISDRMQKERGHYCYDTMDPELQQLYVEILLILEAHKEDILVSATDAEDLNTAFMCVFQDHPEMYWYDGYYYRCYERGLGEPVFTFTGRYTYSKEECAEYEPKIRDYIRQCLQKLPAGADQYETVKYIYEYVILNTDYAITARDSQNILSVMLYHSSVCQGYAKTVQYLLQEAGIPATLVVGRVFGDRQGHAWNLVKIDGAYYYLDATWGDAAFEESQGEGIPVGDEGINYRFLNITSEELSATHLLENPVAMPYCVSTDANYYVREGYYLTEYNTTKVRGMFLQASAAREHVVSIKCADAELYREVRGRLIDDQEVFDMLPSRSSEVSFHEDTDMHILTIWF